jgi:hypothetical protein
MKAFAAQHRPVKTPLSYEEVKSQILKHLNPRVTYTLSDISHEALREIVTSSGVYSIKSPIALVVVQGGSLHQVFDDDGTGHCYAAPETGNSIVRYLTKYEKS